MNSHCQSSQQQQHFMYRQLNSVSSPPPTSIMTKRPIMNPPRQTLTPSKSCSPRPPHSCSPGYSSPPPNSVIPVTTCPTSYSSFSVNLSVCPSPPHITTNTQQQSSSDVVDDILNTFCNQPTNPTPSCSPQSSPRCFSTEPLIDSIGFNDNHSGPVSPDEFNRYLPNNNHVIGSNFGATSCHQQQDYTNVYSNSTIGMVQPSSLGQFSQNP